MVANVRKPTILAPHFAKEVQNYLLANYEPNFFLRS
jgi:hypothetical protein